MFTNLQDCSNWGNLRKTWFIWCRGSMPDESITEKAKKQWIFGGRTCVCYLTGGQIRRPASARTRKREITWSMMSWRRAPTRLRWCFAMMCGNAYIHRAYISKYRDRGPIDFTRTKTRSYKQLHATSDSLDLGNCCTRPALATAPW